MFETSKDRRNHKYFIFIALFCLLLAVVVRDRLIAYYSVVDQPTESVKIIKEPITKPIVPPEVETKEPPQKIKVTLPLKVPFTSQAPFGIWDVLHQEACEEASLLMVYYYVQGKTISSTSEIDEEIKNMISWEEKNGYKVDLTVKELVAVATDYLKLETGRIITSPTISQLKAELEQGRPIIVPAAGRELKNPYFTPPGPIYHMLVIKGYDDTGFITNDPGTRRGESYHYPYDRFMNAIHDWDSTNILNGQKGVVVFD